METASPPPNVKALGGNVFHPNNFQHSLPRVQGTRKQAGGEANPRKLSDGVSSFPGPSGPAHEIGELGEWQGRYGWVTEAKEPASGDGLGRVRVSLARGQCGLARGVYDRKSAEPFCTLGRSREMRRE